MLEHIVRIMMRDGKVNDNQTDKYFIVVFYKGGGSETHSFFDRDVRDNFFLGLQIALEHYEKKAG